MMEDKISVAFVWVDNEGKQAGARLIYNRNSARFQDVPLGDIQVSLRGKLENAVVTGKGLRGKVGVTLLHRVLVKKTEKEIALYTLMHKDSVVCLVYRSQSKVEVFEPSLLPFALLGGEFTSMDFENWLNKRVDNLSRTYMNKVYIARKVGRDREAILRDSCAMSIVDNYWVRRSDISTSWEELKSKRDANLSLVVTALTGEVKDWGKEVTDTTSLFTIKGAFPKAVYKGRILKKDNNAEYEYCASVLGGALGILTAKARKLQNGVIGCDLFTSEDVSMVHVSDLLKFTDYQDYDDIYRALHVYCEKELKREDLTRQLERLYIFNYLVSNIDFHQENFGFLYDSNTFEFISIAPAYDFNSAFVPLEKTMFYIWIIEQLPAFMGRHNDLKKRLETAEFKHVLQGLVDLSDEQKESIRERAKYLCSL